MYRESHLTQLGDSERRALELIVSGQVSSRAQVAQALALSNGRVSKLIASLISHGYLEESEEILRGTGRPARILLPVADRIVTLGVKLTPDMAFGTWIDMQGKQLHYAELSIEGASIDAAVKATAELMERSPFEYDVAAIGVGLPATVDPDGRGVHDVAYLGWSSGRLADAVEARTGLRTVLSNDVNAATTYEHWFGLGRGCKDLAVLTLGTGIGCGLIVSGEIVHGVEGRSGLLSHLEIDRSGPICDLGHRGCLSSYASIPSILRQASPYFPGRSFEDLLEIAETGNAIANRIFSDAAIAIGRALALVVNMLGPERVIVTGDGIAVYTTYGDAVNREFERARHWRAAKSETLVDHLPLAGWSKGAAAVALRSVIRDSAAPIN
ncbi:ROK family protein [Pseudarthrobacter sp. NBSH8]|nr:ROK family protein [Pseudarthrobacter sp. NBSH8]